MSSIKQIQVYEEETSVKDFVLKIQSLIRLLFRNIILLAVIGLIGGLLGFFIAKYGKVYYKSELRFIVKSEGSSTGLSGMLGGLSSVLGGGTMGSPLERAIEIVSSDRIVGSALLKEIQIEGKKEILANGLIRFNNLHQEWGKDSSLNKLIFNSQDTSIELMSLPKRKAIKKLEALLIPKSGNGIITKSFDKKSGVVTLCATHTNEDFAIVLTKEIYNQLRNFYVEQMITSAANNVLVLQKKVDSIKYELSRVQSSFARTTDKSFGLLFQEDKVELRKYAVKEQILLAMYAEAQKNLETFKFMNDSAIPSLTVIDMPYSPLKKIERNKTYFTLGGFFLGFFFAFMIFAFQRWYKNLMSS